MLLHEFLEKHYSIQVQFTQFVYPAGVNANTQLKEVRGHHRMMISYALDVSEEEFNENYRNEVDKILSAQIKELQASRATKLMNHSKRLY